MMMMKMMVMGEVIEAHGEHLSPAYGNCVERKQKELEFSH